MINILPRLMLATALILLLPLLAMQFTDEVDWDVADFVIFGALIISVGLVYELASRKAKESGNAAYKTAAGLALAAAFLLFWINGAVGIIGSENNDANLLYFGVFAVGIVGSFLVRFRPYGMTIAMAAAAVTQALVPVIALIIWRPTGWGAAGMIGVFALNGFFVALWAESAFLFQKAARGQAPTAEELDLS